MTKDYYEILHVDRTATKKEIKTAFRRLAKEHHPDVSDSEDAEERFKTISEAYEVLSDKRKRSEYDASNGQKEMFEDGFDWNDFTKYDDLRDIFGSGSSRSNMYWTRDRYKGPSMGKDITKEVTVTFEDAYKGTSMQIEVPHVAECATCHGSGAFPGSGMEMCPVCKGLGQVKQINTRGVNRYVTIQSCLRCYGKGKIMGRACEDCKGSGKISSTRMIRVTVPPGVSDGTTLRIPGQGHEGIMGGRRGDLYVRVSVIPDERFERRGADLITEVPISFSRAALGGSISVRTMDGEARVDVPQGTQTHTLLRLKEKGMPRMSGMGRGDLLVRVKIITPKKLNKQQRELLKAFASEEREDLSTHDEGGGIFQRFKFFKKD